MAELATFGGYVLLKRLGRGAMGDVHLARPLDPHAPSPLVIKRLRGELASDQMAVRRFRHEAELVSFVKSPHVVRLHEAGIIDGTLFIAMEYVAGWPLSRIIEEHQRRQRLPPIPAVLDVMEGVLRGLSDLHGAVHPDTGARLGIIHRDISPKNIMVGEDGRTRLIDLGIGRSNARDWKTGTGLIVGTPGYMPPEQAFGDGQDHRADLYAAGVVMFELLTLVPYIEHGPIGKMLQAAMVAQPRSPSSIRPDISPALDAIVLRAVALKPEQRFASADQLLGALLRLGDTERTDAPATLTDDQLEHKLELRKTEVSNLLQDTAILDTLSSPVPETVPSMDAHRSRSRWMRLAAVVLAGGALAATSAVLARALLAPRDGPSPPAVTVEAREAIAPPPAPSVTAHPLPPAEGAVVRATKSSKPRPPALPPMVPAALKPDVKPELLLSRAYTLRMRVPKGSERETAVNAVIRRINLEMPVQGSGHWSELEQELERLERE